MAVRDTCYTISNTDLCAEHNDHTADSCGSESHVGLVHYYATLPTRLH